MDSALGPPHRYLSSQNRPLGKPKNTMSGIKETKPLAEIDPEMFELIQQEYNRQTGGLELIASEVRLCLLADMRWAAGAGH